jgi:hypothetical protein
MSRYVIRERKEQGAPYTRYSIFIDGSRTPHREQMHPFSADQIADALNPKVYAPRPYIEPMKKPGPKGKGAKPAWSRDIDDMEDAA